MIIIMEWIVDFLFNKMQLKPQYAATGDHNSQDMSLIQRMMAVIADGYAKKKSFIGYRQVMYKGYKRVPDFATIYWEIHSARAVSWKNGDSATAFHCRFNGTQSRGRDQFGPNVLLFQNILYSVLGNLYSVDSLMYVQMQVMDQDEENMRTQH